MHSYRDIYNLKRVINNLKEQGKSLGFVPTMGALHKGHLSLIERAKQENEKVLCSIFVNPKQFNQAEDLEKYPRTEMADLEKLTSCGCDLVFIPTVEEIYPAGEIDPPPISFDGLENVMEGRFRPGHFQGVARVVSRLFDIVLPDRAYFGEKDFQQLQIIRQLVIKQKRPIEIVGLPTYRNPDGLALSSRNTRLSLEFATEAPKIFKALKWAKEHYSDLSIMELKKGIQEQIENGLMKVEYVEFCNENTLVPISKKNNKSVRLFISVFADNVRLIDNIHITS